MGCAFGDFGELTGGGRGISSGRDRVGRERSVGVGRCAEVTTPDHHWWRSVRRPPRRWGSDLTELPNYVKRHSGISRAQPTHLFPVCRPSVPSVTDSQLPDSAPSGLHRRHRIVQYSARMLQRPRISLLACRRERGRGYGCRRACMTDRSKAVSRASYPSVLLGELRHWRGRRTV